MLVTVSGITKTAVVVRVPVCVPTLLNSDHNARSCVSSTFGEDERVFFVYILQ